MERSIWQGVYRYEDLEGHNRTGFFMTVDFALIVPSDASQPATLTMTGYQTNRTLLCALLPTRQRLEVRFLSFANGATVNEYGVAEFTKDELLFTLGRTAKGRFITAWNALDPAGAHKKRGRYFVLSGTGVTP